MRHVVVDYSYTMTSSFFASIRKTAATGIGKTFPMTFYKTQETQEGKIGATTKLNTRTDRLKSLSDTIWSIQRTRWPGKKNYSLSSKLLQHFPLLTKVKFTWTILSSVHYRYGFPGHILSRTLGWKRVPRWHLISAKIEDGGLSHREEKTSNFLWSC